MNSLHHRAEVGGQAPCACEAQTESSGRWGCRLGKGAGGEMNGSQGMGLHLELLVL